MVWANPYQRHFEVRSESRAALLSAMLPKCHLTLWNPCGHPTSDSAWQHLVRKGKTCIAFTEPPSISPIPDQLPTQEV